MITIPLWAFWSLVGIGAFESVVLIAMWLDSGDV
jgi:hypothetical protein